MAIYAGQDNALKRLDYKYSGKKLLLTKLVPIRDQSPDFLCVLPPDFRYT